MITKIQFLLEIFRIFLYKVKTSYEDFLIRKAVFAVYPTAIFQGRVRIQIRSPMQIQLGSNVVFNGCKDFHHVSMFGGVYIHSSVNTAKLRIGNNTRLNGVCINFSQSIEIGNNCLIASNVQIFDNNGHLSYLLDPAKRIDINLRPNSKPIIIGNNCWICTGAVILPGTHLGDNCIVGANMVIKGKYPANSCIK